MKGCVHAQMMDARKPTEVGEPFGPKLGRLVDEGTIAWLHREELPWLGVLKDGRCHTALPHGAAGGAAAAGAGLVPQRATDGRLHGGTRTRPRDRENRGLTCLRATARLRLRLRLNGRPLHYP